MQSYGLLIFSSDHDTWSCQRVRLPATWKSIDAGSSQFANEHYTQSYRLAG